jgi:CheY-like chemotaxis protein
MNKENLILIIEDDNDVRESLAEVLRSCGHNVHEACHGQHALDELMRISVPALVILDAMMPVMDGPAFYAEFRKSEKFCHVPVVLFSAVTSKITLEGLAGRLQKPADIEDILSLVSKFCS